MSELGDEQKEQIKALAEAAASVQQQALEITNKVTERNSILKRKKLWVITTCVSVFLDIFLTVFLSITAFGVNSNSNVTSKLNRTQAAIQNSLYQDCVARIQFENTEFVDHVAELQSLQAARTGLLKTATTPLQIKNVHLQYDDSITAEQVYVNKIQTLLFDKICNQYVQVK